MALKPCRECGKEVSSKAKMCPNCGVKNPVKESFLANFFVAAIIFVVLLALISAGADKNPSDADKQKITGSQPNSRPLSANEINDNFIHCITPKAQYEKYSSYDGGKSAMELVEECPHEASDWIDSCVQSGDERNNCNLKSVMLAQVALKSFGK